MCPEAHDEVSAIILPGLLTGNQWVKPQIAPGRSLRAASGIAVS
jgi:hypothetical protein